MGFQIGLQFWTQLQLGMFCPISQFVAKLVCKFQGCTNSNVVLSLQTPTYHATLCNVNSPSGNLLVKLAISKSLVIVGTHFVIHHFETTCTAMGLLTSWDPSVHVYDPNTYSPVTCDAVKVILNVSFSPVLVNLSTLGVIKTLIPDGACITDLYTLLAGPTFVTVLVTILLPFKALIAIDG